MILKRSIFVLIFVLISIGFSQESFEDWAKKDTKQFKNFMEKDDKVFTDFLKKDWKEFQALEGIKADTKPKPKAMPKAKPKKKIDDETNDIKLSPVVKKTPPKIIPKPKPQIKTTDYKNYKFQLYGINLDIPVDKKINLSTNGKLDNKQISKIWEKIATTKYKKTLEYLEDNKKNLLLNDWGYVMMTYNLSKSIFVNQVNKQKIFVWFYLVKSGYDVKIGYIDNQIVLLMPSKTTIYSTSYTKLNEQRYYVINLEKDAKKVKSFYTYSDSHSASKNIIDLKLLTIPNFTDKNIEKILRFTHKGKKHNLKIAFDMDAINLMESYPQTEISIYFNIPLAQDTKNSIVDTFEPYLSGKTELEAVNFLLKLVQTSFQYKTDDDQFGREKYFAPEETFFYPYSDCEDRSILFSYLISNLTNLTVVGLDYPGHISTAVQFNKNVDGDKIKYKDATYLICDPTYINATVGMCMPQFKTINPKIIAL
ncbi:MAG: hypothetical protein U9N76_05555 [Candidatus Marinimicrobia bacterium]|nr:hypothetical protein [Candidatus Neomarinimicrobiota bacterium]